MRSAVVAIPDGIRAGVLLGDRVGVVALAAQRRAAGSGRSAPGVPCASTLYAVGTCQESAFVERPNCSSTRYHSTWRPALPAVLGGVQPAAEPALEALAPDALDLVRGQLAVGALGVLLERDQHLVHERGGARLDLELGGIGTSRASVGFGA